MVKEPSLAEIVQAYLYHSMLLQQVSDRSEEDHSFDFNSEKETSGDDNEDGGDEGSEGEGSEPVFRKVRPYPSPEFASRTS